jgi:hypothetical protein
VKIITGAVGVEGVLICPLPEAEALSKKMAEISVDATSKLVRTKVFFIESPATLAQPILPIMTK